MILEIMQYVLILIAAVFIGYQLMLSLAALLSKAEETKEVAHKRNFLVLVHSHNRGHVLGQTLYSLSGMIYPWNLYELVLIADNCTDDTAKIAQELGLQVLDRNNAEGKGSENIFDWALGQMDRWHEHYDAVVIVEAGSLISSSFLKVMNGYIEKGSQVIQSSNLISDYSQIWEKALIRIAYLLRNNVNALGRKMLGFSTTLNGNGMCFRSEILQQYPLGANQEGSNPEYSLYLLSKGISVDFAPEAQLWILIQEELPIKGKYFPLHKLQRSIISIELKRLREHFFTKQTMHLTEALLNMVSPFIDKLIISFLIILAATIVLWGLGYINAVFIWIWLVLIFLAGLYLGIGIIVDKRTSTFINDE